MQRTIQPEFLDELPATDPRAIRSRRDLRRINAWMGNAGIIARHLQRMLTGNKLPRVVELGAGDGTFLLAVARRLPRMNPAIEAVLVDRHDLLAPETAEALRARGWNARAVASDAMEWLDSTPNGAGEVVLANLFLHHFTDEQLRRLLGLIATRAQLLVACDPGRTTLSSAGVALLPLIGCGAMTRHDARVSVRAGFVGGELSALWPSTRNWTLHESAARVFSHCFVAKRTSVDE